MRIIRIVVVLLTILAMVFPFLVSANESPNTETNTNSTLLYFSNLFTANPALADEGIDPIAAQSIEKSPEEIQNDAILAVWKSKQADRWTSLSRDAFEINASAYTASADECGKSDGITASGIKAKAGRTIACPPNFPFGAKIKIDNLGTFVCEDRGGAIKGNKIDIYVQTKSEAFQFGRQHLIAQVVD